MSGIPEYDRFDALGLAELVRSGEVSALELLEEAIARAEAMNPRLNAIIIRMYDIARGAALSPRPGAFGGVPFLLKDLLHAYAGVPLSSGSAALKAYVPDQDSHLVSRFKAAGLLIFGKTNLPELGLLGITEPKAFGATRNPWDLERSPGGSSGGSAAAVISAIVPMASATDGAGSIRIPAAWCGLFGLKPSRARVSVGPYFAEVWDGAVVDHVITRTVRDSAAALDAAIGSAPGDPIRYAAPERPFLEEIEVPPGRLRIAYTTRSPIGSPVDPECAFAVELTARLLTDIGHDVEEREAPIDGMAAARAYLTVAFAHVAADLRWIVERCGTSAARTQVEELTKLAGLLGETISAAEFVQAKQRWNDFGRAMGGFHQRYDLYLTPTTASLPLTIGSLEPSPLERIALRLVNSARAGRLSRASGLPEKLALEQLGPFPFTQLANLTGQPAMSVPVHWTSPGLPCGAHFMAAVGNEALLFRVAAQLEFAVPWHARRPPVHASKTLAETTFHPEDAENAKIRDEN